MFDPLLKMLGQGLLGLGFQSLSGLLSGSGSGAGGGSGGTSGSGSGSSGCTAYYQTSDISKLSDPCAQYVAPTSSGSIDYGTGSGECDPLAAALGRCGGTGSSTTEVGTGVETGTSGGCDALSTALGLCGGTNTGGTGGSGGSGGTGGGGCDPLSAALGLCGAGTSTSVGTSSSSGNDSGDNTDAGNECSGLNALFGLCDPGSGNTSNSGGGHVGSSTDIGSNPNGSDGDSGGENSSDSCSAFDKALGLCGCNLLSSTLGLCTPDEGTGNTNTGGNDNDNGGGVQYPNTGGVCDPLSEALGQCGQNTNTGTSTPGTNTGNPKKGGYTIIYTSTRKNADGTYTIVYHTNNPDTPVVEVTSPTPKKPRIMYQPVTGFNKSSGDGGERGDILARSGDATVIAGTRDTEKNTETSGFYGSQTFGNQGSQGLVAKWCQARPWAGGFLEKVVPASFFDGICKARGYQVGMPPPPAPTTTLQQTPPTKIVAPVITKPATSTAVRATSTPSAPPRVDMWAVPPTVPLGTRTSVFWSAQNVVDCTETSSDGQFNHKTLSGGSATVPIIEQTTFTISCLVSDGTTASKSISVGLKL